MLHGISGSTETGCRLMWAKIVLCCFLWLSVLGNVALAAPSSPAPSSSDQTAGTKQQNGQQNQQKPPPALVKEVKAARDRAVTASEIVKTAKIAAEKAKQNAVDAKNASIDAFTRMELAKSEAERSKEQVVAQKKLAEAKTQAATAKAQADIAKKQADVAEKAKGETSTFIRNFIDSKEIQNMQNVASEVALIANKDALIAARSASDAQQAVYDAQNVKNDKLGQEPFSDCGTWAVSCHIDAWFYNTAKRCLLGVYELLSVVFNQKNIANDPVIIKLQMGFSSLSWTFLLLFLTYQLIRIMSLMILQEDYSDLKTLIRNTVIAAWLVSSLTWICNHLFEFGGYFTEFALEQIKTVQENINILLMIAFVKPFSDYILVLLVVLAIICLIIIIQMAVRSAEFAFLVIIGPLVAVTIVNKEMNFFSRWWRSLLAVIFTQSIQALFFVTAFQLIASASIANLLAIIGFLVLTLRAPQMVKEWLQSSNSIGGGSAAVGVSAARGAVEGWSKGRGIAGKFVGGLKGGVAGGIASGGQALFGSLTKK